jgi:hypothetical protein
MNFTENSRYLLEQSIFNRSILTCHCVQDGVAYLSASPSSAYLSDTPSSQVYTEKVEYKYNIKKQRMYVFNKAMQTWDTCEGYEISEFAVGNANTGYQSVSVV